MRTITCQVCGSRVQTVSATIKYCPDCRPIVWRAQSAARYHALHHDGQRPDYRCLSCNAPLDDGRLYQCPTCLAAGKTTPSAVRRHRMLSKSERERKAQAQRERYQARRGELTGYQRRYRQLYCSRKPPLESRRPSDVFHAGDLTHMATEKLVKALDAIIQGKAIFTMQVTR